MLKLCKINACPNGTLGLHLSRAPWDPYPWVSGVTEGSSAYLSGIRIGDTILEYNGVDVLGWKIFELANKIHSYWDLGGKFVNFLIWRNKSDNQYQQNDSGPNINQQSLQKFATCLQNIAQLLECPVCLEVVKPPGWQCCNGHVLCNGCRCRTIKCPICRVPLGPRGRCLLSDKLFTLLAESFPCDGVKNDNKNGRCPEDNHKINRTTFKTNLTTTLEDRNLLIDKTTTRQNDCNINVSNNNSISSGQRIRIKTSIPKDDENINKKQIISIKVKSPQILSVPLTLQSTEPTTSTTTTYSPSVVTILNNTFSSSTSSCISSIPVISSSISLPTKSITNTTTKISSSLNLNQHDTTEYGMLLYKNYHCPTGKSCNFQENDENIKIYNTTINNFRLTIPSATTRITTLKNKNKIDNSQSINHNIQWDILTHLRRVHQLFICQYYGSFGENFQIDLIKENKSIFCISIDTKFLKNNSSTFLYDNKLLNFDNHQIENFVKIQNENLQNDSLYLTVENFNSNDIIMENFTNTNSNDNNSSDVTTSINSVNSSYKNSINNEEKIIFSDTELFFIANIPLIDEENINISTTPTTTSETLIKKNNIKIIDRKSSLINDRYQNDYISDIYNFNKTDDINKNIENLKINTSTNKDFGTTITIDDTIPSSSSSSSSTTDLNVSCRNFVSSSCLPSSLTLGYKQKCAIFLWYCGNDCNVKNFKAFIKFNGKIEKIIIPIHSITTSWNVIQCRREFIEFDRGNETQFEIQIDSILNKQQDI